MDSNHNLQVLREFRERCDKTGRMRYPQPVVTAIMELLDEGFSANEIFIKTGVPKSSINNVRVGATRLSAKLEQSAKPAEFTVKVGKVEITTNDKSVLSAIFELAGGK
jgi:hypothetical protein